VVDALDRGRPEPAAMAPSKKELTGQSVKQFLATRPMQDKQHVFAVGAFGVFVEPDVGAQLRAETADQGEWPRNSASSRPPRGVRSSIEARRVSPGGSIICQR